MYYIIIFQVIFFWKHIVGSYFLIHLENLTGEFRTFTFNVIIYMLGLSLPFYYLFSVLFIFLFLLSCLPVGYLNNFYYHILIYLYNVAKLTMALGPPKHIYHKPKMHLLHLTYQTQLSLAYLTHSQNTISKKHRQHSTLSICCLAS